MTEPKSKYKILFLVICFAAFLLFILTILFDSAGIIDSLNILKINNHQRFNAFAIKTSFVFFLVILIITVFYFFRNYSEVIKLRENLRIIFEKFSSVLNLKTLLVINLIYIVILFIIAVMNYDLGTDEACYVVYTRTILKYGLPMGLVNGKIFQIDYYSYLPEYIVSVLFSIFNPNSVWFYKLIAVIISSLSIATIFYVIKKIYSFNAAVLFLFFLTVHPGFGYVSTSFFAEIPQTAIIFIAAYYWLYKNESVKKKTIMLTSLLFALAIHTKIQAVVPVILGLVLFRFIDESKKPLRVLFYTLFFTFIIALIRLIPALFYNPDYILYIPRFWFLFSQNISSSFLKDWDRLVWFNKFFPLILFVLIIGYSVLKDKLKFESFICSYSVFIVLWWIFYYNLLNYRLIFLGVVPLVFLMALLVIEQAKKRADLPGRFKLYVRYFFAFCILILGLWGFTTNIIYAYIGYNDGVQFDLDGYRVIHSEDVKRDNSQKNFYYDLNTMLGPKDSIFVPANGISTFVSQFYLGTDKVFPVETLKSSLSENNSPKLIIIDRISFPLGLEKGYQKLDSLGVNRKLLLKKGQYELYELSKKNITMH